MGNTVDMVSLWDIYFVLFSIPIINEISYYDSYNKLITDKTLADILRVEFCFEPAYIGVAILMKEYLKEYADVKCKGTDKN